MPTPAKEPQQAVVDRDQNGTNAKVAVNGGSSQPSPAEESLGEQLIREGREGHAGFVAGWSNFMEGLGIQGNPIEPGKLREMLLQEGIDPNSNEFSRGIIAMREE